MLTLGLTQIYKKHKYRRYDIIVVLRRLLHRLLLYLHLLLTLTLTLKMLFIMNIEKSMRINKVPNIHYTLYTIQIHQYKYTNTPIH